MLSTVLCLFFCLLYIYSVVVVDLKMALYLPNFIDIVLQINILHLCLLIPRIIIIIIIMSTSFPSSVFISFKLLISWIHFVTRIRTVAVIVNLFIVVVVVIVTYFRLLGIIEPLSASGHCRRHISFSVSPLSILSTVLFSSSFLSFIYLFIHLSL